MKNPALIILAAFTAASAALAAGADTTNAPSTNVTAIVTNVAVSTNVIVAKLAAPSTNAPEADADLAPTNAVRMNFHDVPLNTVLNYLSKRMGFVVVSDAEVHGNATIVSEQPVGTNEVINLLSDALAKNNYAVSRDGRVLTITTADSAKLSPQTPVNHPEGPADIPINDEMATDILPVHTLNPTQLIKDLDSVIPQGTTVSANEAGNAVIMTGRQKDIHRFSEIIAALDSTSISEVEVFVLKFGDAKSVSDELKEIFQSPDSNVSRADARTRFQGRGGGFGGFPGFGGGGGGGDNNNNTEKNASDKAVFTSDDQMNAVIASAPPDYFRMISNVVDQLDQPTTDITEIKTFQLTNSDATEMANELTSLFPDPDSSNSQNGRSMGTRFLPPWMQPQAAASTKSARMTQAALVRVVPDPRTSSIIVTTSKDLMEQIAGVVEALDKSTAQTQHVFAWDLSTADPVTVQAALTALFANGKTSTSSTTTESALSQRQLSTAQSQTTTSSTSGFGTTGGGGGAGGGGVP